MPRTTQQRRSASRRVAIHEEGEEFGSEWSGEAAQQHTAMRAQLEEPYWEDTGALGGLDPLSPDLFDQYVDVNAISYDVQETRFYGTAEAQLSEELDDLAYPRDETQYTPALQTRHPRLGGWGPENILQPEVIRLSSTATVASQPAASSTSVGFEDYMQRELLQNIAARASSLDHHNLASNLAASGVFQSCNDLGTPGGSSSLGTGPSLRPTQASATQQYTTPETSFGSYSDVRHNYSASFCESIVSASSTGHRYSCQHELPNGSLCNKGFDVRSALDKHETSHLEKDQRPFSCPECDEYRSNKKADVERHRRSKHTSEKPFWCLWCQIGFPRPDNLKRHWKSKKCPAPKPDLARSTQSPTADSDNPQNSSLSDMIQDTPCPSPRATTSSAEQPRRCMQYVRR